MKSIAPHQTHQRSLFCRTREWRDRNWNLHANDNDGTKDFILGIGGKHNLRMHKSLAELMLSPRVILNSCPENETRSINKKTMN